jgi:hypothetical protein
MLDSRITLPLAIAATLVACGTPPAPSTTPTTPAAASNTTSSAASASSAPPETGVSSGTETAPPKTVAATAVDAGAPRSTGPVTLEALFGKDVPRSTFPKASVGEHDCWQGLGLTGQHDKDYALLIEKCGSPTGLAEYVHPVTGHVHHKHKRRDVYTLHLLKGLCYRYFAVGDSTIADLDILVLRNGSLIADDKTTHPVAIIEGDKPWCMEHDETYDFSIEVEGPGNGRYTFGVWAKPKG